MNWTKIPPDKPCVFVSRWKDVDDNWMYEIERIEYEDYYNDNGEDCYCYTLCDANGNGSYNADSLKERKDNEYLIIEKLDDPAEAEKSERDAENV
jgi:hypothetical protein